MSRVSTRIAWGLCLAAATGVQAADALPVDPVYRDFASQAERIKPSPEQLRWQQMPWVIDPAEAIRQAKEEKRPILFWAAGGRDRDGVPLERC
jgi:hypothetical protein